MDKGCVLQADGLWKRYGLPLLPSLRQGAHRLLTALGSSRTPPQELPWAMEALSFSAFRGETLGIIGRNGSGKSTLLKLLAGVSRPTRGTVWAGGTIFPMIELNAGIHMDLTGRENVRLLGAVMGLSPGQMRVLIPQIQAFSELEEWFDQPVRMYSSGMLVRLGFSVGVYTRAEILLMDEVLAVGDIPFSNKCLRHLEQVRNQGSCILFVSHDMMRIRRVCDRVLVLDQGKVVYLGDAEEGVRQYQQILQRAQDRRVVVAGDCPAGLGLFNLVVQSPGGRPLPDPVPQGHEVEVRFTLQLEAPLGQGVVQVVVENQAGRVVVCSELAVAELKAGRRGFVVRWNDLRLGAGGYSVRVGLGCADLGEGVTRLQGAASWRMAGSDDHLGAYSPVTRLALVKSEDEAAVATNAALC